MTEQEIADLKKKLADAEAKASALAAEKAALEESVAAEKKASAPVSFKVKADEKAGIEGGTYVFTAPSFTHKGEVINVRQLEAAAGKDKKALEKYQSLCAMLVTKGSGIVKRKEAK